MKKYTREEARNIAMNCAKQYENCLLDKKLIIIYRDKESHDIKYLEVLFLDRNYQHLTGLELTNANGFIQKHQSINFYRKCIQNKLYKNEILFKQDGTTHLKLAALPSLTKIYSITKITSDYNGSRPYLYADKVIGGINFCMGLVKDGDLYTPISALSEDIKKVASNPSQVLVIMSKHKDDNCYKKICHVAKGLNLHNLSFSEEIMNLISLIEYIPKE